MSEQAMTFGEAMCAMEKGEICEAFVCGGWTRYRLRDGLLEESGDNNGWSPVEPEVAAQTIIDFQWRKAQSPTEYPIELWQAVRIMTNGRIVIRKHDGNEHQYRQLPDGTLQHKRVGRLVPPVDWENIQSICTLGNWFTTTPPEPEPADVDKRIAKAVAAERNRCSTLAYEQWAQSKRDEDTAIKNKDYGVASCAQHAQLVLDCLRRNIELVSL